MVVGQSRGSEVTVGLAGCPSSLEHDGVLTERRFHSQLLEGQDGSSCFRDPAVEL